MRDPATLWNAHRDTTRECNDPEFIEQKSAAPWKKSPSLRFSRFLSDSIQFQFPALCEGLVFAFLHRSIQCLHPLSDFDFDSSFLLTEIKDWRYVALVVVHWYLRYRISTSQACHLITTSQIYSRQKRRNNGVSARLFLNVVSSSISRHRGPTERTSLK
jgi:hypothetical protein